MTIPAITITSIILVGWITLAIIKYQYLKKAHEALVVGLAKKFNDIKDDDIKRAMVNDAKTRKLLLEGLSAISETII